MQRTLLVAATLLVMWAGAAMAQPASETLDQSLLNSEPVEEIPEEKPPAAKAIPVPPSPPATEEEAEPPLEADTAILQGLKKVTAETSAFEAPVDTPTRFGTLLITVKKCRKSAPGERPENTALMLIQDIKPDTPPDTAFSGWMFSSSPGISSLEHPVYDITLLECENHKDKKPAAGNQR